jgi:hypothetical protein
MLFQLDNGCRVWIENVSEEETILSTANHRFENKFAYEQKSCPPENDRVAALHEMLKRPPEQKQGKYAPTQCVLIRQGTGRAVRGAMYNDFFALDRLI